MLDVVRMSRGDVEVWRKEVEDLFKWSHKDGEESVLENEEEEEEEEEDAQDVTIGDSYR